jgi:CBS domain-containing protein/sporulation protein YlmC with PRC-barrel domain
MLYAMTTLALSEVLGAPVYDPSGAAGGRVREVALAPGEDRSRVAALIVKTKNGNRVLPFTVVGTINGGIRTTTGAGQWAEADGTEGFFLLERDLLDQQVIDINGRKVVRVNDVDLNVDAVKEAQGARPVLRVSGVDVGARGAVRRLLRGVVPVAALRLLLRKIPQRTIPWDFVDLIETDPARRVKLKISHDRLASLHPADIADIVENLAPNEREAVFETLNEEVAAEALEEVAPKVQKSIVESLDSERAADIVEEMDPGAAADLLGDLNEEHTEQILVQMEPEERQEVIDLLEHKEKTAAGRMTTDFLALPEWATVEDAVDSMREFEGGVEAVSTIYLVDREGKLVGDVPLPKIALAEPRTPMRSLTQVPLVRVYEDVGDNAVAELFDKYNLLMLPVVDKQDKLMGVITADKVINMLRAKL